MSDKRLNFWKSLTLIFMLTATIFGFLYFGGKKAAKDEAKESNEQNEIINDTKSATESESVKETILNRYVVIAKSEVEGLESYQYIEMYDEETKVIYSMFKNGEEIKNFSVIYDADGKPKIYQEKD